MKIQYLGTAAAEGIPAIFCNCEYCKQARENGGKDIRTRSQAIIDDRLLVDFPADSFSHMKDFHLNFADINSILITHTHNDHFYPEDLGLRCKAFCHDMKGELTLYGNDRMVKKFSQMYKKDPSDTHLNGLLSAKEIEPYRTEKIEGYEVTPMLANHDKNERCYLYCVEKQGKTLLYGNDTGWLPQQTWDFLNGRHFNCVSLDCTLLRYRLESVHMGIPNVIETRKKLEDMNCTDDKTVYVVTHFSHNGHMLHKEAAEALKPYAIHVAYDGYTVTF